MSQNLRTAALVAAGVVSAASAARAEEAMLNPVNTALTATTISGYVSGSAFFNVGEGDANVRLPGRAFDGSDKINQINLDVVKLTIERPLDEGDWSAGYRVDLLFGPDANTYATTSTGSADSDFAIKQAYVALQAPVGNGLTAKIGVWDTVVGYEVFDSGDNPNYSRSYGYFLEPTEHTGILLSYDATDWLSLSAGIADSYDARINGRGRDSGAEREFGIQTYMGSVAITVPSGWGFLEGATFYGGVVHGLTSGTDQTDMNGDVVRVGVDDDPRTLWYAGVTVPTPWERLAVGAAFDYLDTSVGGKDQWATAIAGYLTFQATDQMRLSLRGEFAKGTMGTWAEYATKQEKYFALTTTVDYLLWDNVLTRFEFRWDNDLASDSANFGTTQEPKENSYILGLNVIYNF